MRQWHDILSKVLACGVERPDRTGVGTLALFGQQLEFDNSGLAFPAVTTKKLVMGQVLAELACFLRGYDNLEDFHRMGCTIWDGNGAADYWAPRAEYPGHLGRLYGTRWRAWRISDFRKQPRPLLRPGLEATTLGIANGSGCHAGDPLRHVWNNMLQRCYNPASKKYARYGARGVFVEDRWLEFRAFLEDAPSLPGWNKLTGCKGLQLDKDHFGDGFRYGPKACGWLTAEANNSRARVEWTVERSDQKFTFTNVYQFCLANDLEPSNFSRLLNKGKYRKSVKGFQLVSAKPLEAVKPKYVDQLVGLVASLKHDPYGRRHVVTCWNPAEDIETSLPPCHVLFQAFVANGVLDLRVDMRSVDLFLGLPFDVASFAVLQRLLAREVGLSSGRLVFQLGDAHIYLNHQDAVRTVLGREPLDPPTLALRDGVDWLQFAPDNATLVGYDHHPAVKAELNV